MWVSGLSRSLLGLTGRWASPGSVDPHITLHRLVPKACVLSSTQGDLLGMRRFSKPSHRFLCPDSNIRHLFPETCGTTEGPSSSLRKRLPWAVGEIQSVFPGSEGLQRTGEEKGQTGAQQSNAKQIEVWACSLPVGQKPLEDVGVEPSQGGPEDEMLLSGAGSRGCSPALAAAGSREPLRWSLVN